MYWTIVAVLWALLHDAAKVIYGREKKEKPGKEKGENGMKKRAGNFDPNNAIDGHCRGSFKCTEHSIPTTVKREYTLLIEDKTTWNDINKYCHDNLNGHILTIHDETITNVINKYKDMSLWKNQWSEDIWLGLYMNNHDNKDYTWLGTCSSTPPTYFKWECGQSCDPTLDSTKLCGKAKKDELTWDFEVCGIHYNGVCEQTTGACTFEESTGACIQGSPTKEQITSSVTKEQCKDLCKTKMKSNTECWAVTYIGSVMTSCTLYYSNNPFDFDDDGSLFSTISCTSGSSVIWKRCFDGPVTDNGALNKNYESESKPLLKCTAPVATTTTTTTTTPSTTSATTTSTTTTTTTLPTTSTTSATTTTTTAKPTSTTSTTTDATTTTTTTAQTAATTSTTTDATTTTTTTAQTAATTSTTTDATTTTTTTAQTASTTSTTTDTATTTTTTSGQTAATTSTTTDETTTTTSTSDQTATTVSTTTNNATHSSSTSSVQDSSMSSSTAVALTTFPNSQGQQTANTNMCVCQCYEEYTNASLEEIIQALKKELTVNKKTTSSYLRTLTSASDDRPSAKGIGLGLGVTVISFVIIGLTIGDILNVLRWTAKVLQLKPQAKRNANDGV